MSHQPLLHQQPPPSLYGQYITPQYVGEPVPFSHQVPQFTSAQQTWSHFSHGSFSPQQGFFIPGHAYHRNPYSSGYGPQPVSPQYYPPPGGVSPLRQYQTLHNNHVAESPVFQPGTHGFDHEASGASAAQSSVTRGPPRRPRQSGHALWVGNLPPGSKIMELKDHFSREATKDIESLKLMSKTNCAFVNYRTEEACEAAAKRFDGSYFHNTRLTCRLRKTSTSEVSQSVESTPLSPLPNDEVGGEVPREPGTEDVFQQTMPDVIRRPQRYFILKSLTTRDLEVSTQTGKWATQPHNEKALNDAFESADDVYLIFSANKTGEYFGLARMNSAISTPGFQSSTLSRSSKNDVSDGLPAATAGGPRTIYTPATEWAPEGRIIDDMARGLIFWEAESDSDQLTYEIVSSGGEPYSASPVEEGEKSPRSNDPVIVDSSGASRRRASEDTSFSQEDLNQDPPNKAFRVEWISSRKVRFHRLRGLRNPWNGNREIKVARDGTELETNVGRRLVQEFFLPTAARV